MKCDCLYLVRDNSLDEVKTTQKTSGVSFGDQVQYMFRQINKGKKYTGTLNGYSST